MKKFSDFWTEDLALRAGFVEIRGSADAVISDMTYDSRKVSPGTLFFALSGLHADGHDFIEAALERGASAVVHEKPLAAERPGVLYLRVRDARFAMSPVAAAFYGDPSRRLTVIGVTGTEGKSTTVSLIWQLLRLAGKSAGFVSTVEFSFGGEAKANPEHQTTPEATQVHAALAEMSANGCGFAVVESSSHGLSPRTNRLGDVEFAAGVMTNVTHEHLEFHGTWEQYRDDKANLFRAAKKFCVVNADDQSAGYFAGVTDKPSYSFSTRGGNADYRIEKITSTGEGNFYVIIDSKNGERFETEDRLPGAFNAGNVLAALIVCAKFLNRNIGELIGLVPKLLPVRGRMTAIREGQNFEVIVDYAHTPSSFETIFPPLRERLAPGARIIALFGSGGERDVQKRPAQGAIAGKWADIVVLTDEDPRGEEPMAILEDIAAGVAGKKRDETLFLIPERPEAMLKAFRLAKKNDIVLLLGKGHENSVIYSRGGRKTIDYDETACAKKLLKEIIS